jgi:hypothetical protein
MTKQDMTRSAHRQRKGMKRTYPNTRLPRSEPLRKQQYSGSRVFLNQLAAITAVLEKQSTDFRDELFRFLRWFHPDRCRSLEVADAIAASPKAIRPTLEQYVAFAFRFKVWLHAQKISDANSDGLLIRPVYEKVSGPHLRAQLSGGRLRPVRQGLDPEEDYRENLSFEEVVVRNGAIRST